MDAAKVFPLNPQPNLLLLLGTFKTKSFEPGSHPVRWGILVLLFFAFTINFVDRQVLSLAAPLIREEFNLSNTDYGLIVFCFMLGMTLGQIPVGMMIDRFGARIGFSVILTGWSVVNMLHGLASSLVQLCVLRVLFGLNQCGTYSGGTKILGQWFRPRERALAAGIFNSGTLIGAILAPPIVVFLIQSVGWRWSFVIPSVVGLVWLIPWLYLYWEPWRHPCLSVEARKAERDAFETSDSSQDDEEGAQPSVWMLLYLAPVWGVTLMRTFGGPVTHFYWYWLPEYLKNDRGMTLVEIGLLAWLPFFCGGVGQIGGGWLSSHLIRRGWTVNRARKSVIWLGTLLCLLAVFIPMAPSAAGALTLICLAALGINAISANLISIIGDLFPQKVLARVSAITGVGDGAMSMTMMLLTGVIVDRFSYTPVFIGAAILPVLTLLSLLLLVGKIQPIPMSKIIKRPPSEKK